MRSVLHDLNHLDKTARHRSAIVLESLPWLGYFLRNRLIRSRQAANDQARKRVMKGPTTKDLFHYLVSGEATKHVQITDVPFFQEQRRRF